MRSVAVLVTIGTFGVAGGSAEEDHAPPQLDIACLSGPSNVAWGPPLLSSALHYPADPQLPAAQTFAEAASARPAGAHLTWPPLPPNPTHARREKAAPLHCPRAGPQWTSPNSPPLPQRALDFQCNAAVVRLRATDKQRPKYEQGILHHGLSACLELLVHVLKLMEKLCARPTARQERRSLQQSCLHRTVGQRFQPSASQK